MGVQIPCGVHSQVPQEDPLWGAEVASRGVFRKLAAQKESRIEEGHLMPDHVHMMILILPKYPVSQAVGFIKGKSAIHLARAYGERKRNFVGQHFWVRGCFVSTAGGDEAMIREYSRKQEQEDSRFDQLNMWR
jgi:putative transposase